MKTGLIVIGAAVWLAGCGPVTPKYVRPPLLPAPAPALNADEFKETKDWKAAQPGPGPVAAKWWEIFGDPRLNELEEQVAAGNQNLKVAEARFRQARAAIQVTRAAKYPTVTTVPGIASERISANRPYGLPHPPATGDFVLPFDFSYELDLWGRVRKTIEVARDEARASAADMAGTLLALQAETAYDYFELRSSDAQARLLADTVKNYADALTLTQNRFEGGVAPKSDVAQAQTQLEATRAQVTDLGVMRAQYEHALAILLGRAPSSFSIAPEVTKVEPPSIPVGVPSQLLERRPDIAAAEIRVMEANEQVGLTKIAFYPTVMISAALGLEGSSLLNWMNWPSKFWSVGPSLAQTLFDGGRRKAASEAALAGYDATVASYRETTLVAFQQVEDSLAALRILEKESGEQRRAVESAREAVELFRHRYEGGVDNYLQVLVAQTTLLTNQRAEIDILRRRIDASVLLVKALGGGWDASKLPALSGSTAVKATP